MAKQIIDLISFFFFYFLAANELSGNLTHVLAWIFLIHVKYQNIDTENSA